MQLHRRIKGWFAAESGSALVTVLVLITALTVITGTLLMGLSMHLRLARRDINEMKAFYLAEAAVYKALWRLSGNDGYDWQWRTAREPIEVLEGQSAEVSVREHGGFLEIVSTARHLNQSKQVTVLVGQRMPNRFNKAVIIGGSNFPLVVTGNNQIIGDVLVGKGGVKTGTIKGERFEGDKIVDGTVDRTNSPEMPFFSRQLFDRTIQKKRDLLRGGPDIISDLGRDSGAVAPEKESSTLFLQGYVDSQNLDDSDDPHPLTIISQGELHLHGNGEKFGPVQIVASGEVTLSDSVYLDDAMIFSEKSIEVSENAGGALQLLALGDLTIGGRAILEYPSVLYVKTRVVDNEKTGTITIAGQGQVNGTIIMDDLSTESDAQLQFTSTVVVGPSAQVTGLIFSTNRTTLSGRVHGLIVTDHFYLYESPTRYINWMRDAYVDRRNLSSEFRLPLFFERNPQLEIVVWHHDR